NYQTWNSSNVMLRGLYTRSIYHITVINELLRESTKERLTARGISGNDATIIGQYRAEARFLRAYQYWVLMDLYGNPPFITEENEIGVTPPSQITRPELFNYVEREPLAVQYVLAAAQQNQYPRVDQG